MILIKQFFISVFLFLFLFSAEAQRPVASNGNFKNVNGVRIYYEVSGQGKPLVLMHTFFGTVEQWGNYTQELSREFRVISIDLPCHGRSDCMDTSLVYDNTDAAQYIIGLLGQLGIDSAYFWGVSTGGTIALEMAVLKPQLVSKMVVLGAQLYYSVQTRNWLKKRGLQPADEDGIKDHGLKKANILEKQFYNYAYLYDELNITPDKLSTIKAKSLIVSGDDDVPAPFVSNALQMYQNIPGAHLWVVPGGGHLPHLDEKNHAEFLRRVGDFFK